MENQTPEVKVDRRKNNPNIGRPSTYSPELADYVCKMIATHCCGLKKLTAMYEDFPSQSTIYAWLYEHKEFSGQYFDARKAQATVLADSMLDLSYEIPTFQDKEGNERIDSGMLGKAKLEYEIRKWHAAKMAPRMFGDFNMVESTSTVPDTAARMEKSKQAEKEF